MAISGRADYTSRAHRRNLFSTGKPQLYPLREPAALDLASGGIDEPFTSSRFGHGFGHGGDPEAKKTAA